MKLWWPHNEAMIATLMAYEATGDETWWQRFEMVSRHLFHVPKPPIFAAHRRSLQHSPTSFCPHSGGRLHHGALSR